VAHRNAHCARCMPHIPGDGATPNATRGHHVGGHSNLYEVKTLDNGVLRSRTDLKTQLECCEAMKWPTAARIVRAVCLTSQGKGRRQMLRTAITWEVTVTYMRSKPLIMAF
jgi:hypothetical protein